MIDSDERQAARPSETFCGLDAHEERSDEPRSIRYRDTVDAFPREFCLRHRFADDGCEVPQVIARRELRDDSAVPSV